MVVTEDFHRGFGVGVIGWFEAEVGNAEFGEEAFEESHQAAESEVVISNDTFDLVEFCKMSGVDGLVAEDAVDGEVAARARVGS